MASHFLSLATTLLLPSRISPKQRRSSPFLTIPLLFLLSITYCFFFFPTATADYDWHKEAEAIECCLRIPNPCYQGCSYAALEQVVNAAVLYFAVEGLDPAHLNESTLADLRKEIEEDVVNEAPAALAAEKCTTKGRDMTECCIRSGVRRKCALAVCNGTWNMEVAEKRTVELATQQLLGMAAECGGAGQAKKAASCLLG